MLFLSWLHSFRLARRRLLLRPAGLARQHLICQYAVEIECLEDRRLLTAELDSWMQGDLTEFAQIIDGNNVAAGATTTWPGVPVADLSDIQKISYSSSSVYVQTPDLASYVMGPWYLNAAQTNVFPNYPTDQNLIFKIPRVPVAVTTHTATGLGEIGLFVNGVAMFNSLDSYSYKQSTGTDVAMSGDGIWQRDANYAEEVTFDHAHGHQPQNGEYHYHENPTALRAQLGDNIVFTGTTNYFPHDDVDTGTDTHANDDDHNYEEKTTGLHHSPILGWAKDGNPVYGPYGYTDPNDSSSAIVRMAPNYQLRNITQRHSLDDWAAKLHFGSSASINAQGVMDLPSSKWGPDVSPSFPLGAYIEDYETVDGLGTLDIYNGRFTKTPDYPNGTYAYFITINAAGEGIFPYAVGPQYNSAPTGGKVSSISEPVTVFFDIHNTPPTITDIANQSTTQGTALAPISFTIGDAQTAAGNLVVSIASSNTTLLPKANIVVGGSGASRTLTITPVANEIGTSTVTVTVTDADGNTASDTFDVTVSQSSGLSIGGDVVPAAYEAPNLVYKFTVTLAAPSSQTVTVDFTTEDDTALAGSDYLANSGTLTFSPGETSKIISVAIVNDSKFESTEQFFVRLSNATNSSIDDDLAVGAIADNDLAPTLSINDVSLLEGNNGMQNAVFTVTLSAASGEPVTVDFATGEDTAIAGEDFNSNTGTLTFASGQTTQTITVAVIGDALYEASEIYFVNLSGATNALINDAQGKGTITNDDGIPKLSINDVAVTEGTGSAVNAVFTVSLSAASSVPVTVQFATANSTALSPDDYTAASGTVTFSAGQTTQTITVPVIGDSLDEPSQTFFVNLSSATNASIADKQGVCTILDDELSPGLSVSDVIVSEKTGSVVTAVFTVSLSGPSSLPVKVNYATANDTALASDYLSKRGTLLFSPGQVSKTLSISIIGDTRDELDEDFFMNLSAPFNATISDNQGQCMIADDDATPTLTIDNKTVTEGTGSTVKAIFTVRLSAASGLPVTVNYATEDDTAIATADYTSASNLLTFFPGQISKTISVSVVGDALDEVNESFFVNLSGPNYATLAVGQERGKGTISDNDAIPKLSIGNLTVTEGNSGTLDVVFTVKLSAASGLAVTVDYATVNGSATAGSDYNSTNGSLTFNPGETTKTITVSILGDSVHEQLSKAFSLGLSNALNALFANSQGIGTILDND